MTQNLNFGEAIEALKQGKKAAREGWNGKGMFVFLNKGSKETPVNEGELVDGIKLDLFTQGDVGTATRLPNINMMSASGSIVTGWLASQTDLLAEDWVVLD